MPSTSSTKKKRSSKVATDGATQAQQYIVNHSKGETYHHHVAPSLQQKVEIVVQDDATPVFDSYYASGYELGQGAFADVFLGTHRSTGAEYAIKEIDRDKMIWGDRDALEDEINSLILSREGPSIVQLYEVYQDVRHSYLVTELMRGGELFDRILEKQVFTEKEARDCCRCILEGLAYMHARRVVHRDLKPENLLLQNDIDAKVKLADFGFAKKVVQANGLRTLCGTPGYLAPEILERFPSYDTGCDLWSVGVILFLLLGGYLPFEDEDEDKVFERTRQGLYDFHPTYWKHISPGAKKLLTQLLTVNPQKRITADGALEHEWMNSQNKELDQKEVNTDLLRASAEKQKKQHKIQENRIEDLKKNFDAHLAKHRDDKKGMIDKGDKAPKKSARGQEEDSKTGRPFEDFYDFGELLGEGGYAAVYSCTHRKTQKVYAVKDIDILALNENSKSSLKDEIAAMKLLRAGPHIIRLYDVFEEPERTFMVMEECRGGDLLTRITEKEVYTEREARKTCRILFEAMDYIHKLRIAHRDIKPENILMVEMDDDASIKIADFGFAKRVPKPNCLRTLCGTAQYVAPEVLDLTSPGYDQKADMWSVGVVVYIILGGYAPFEGPVQQLARDICKANYQFHDKYWSDISNSAKDMISHFLTIDPDQRLSAVDALGCSWMRVADEDLLISDLTGARDAMKSKGLAESVKLTVDKTASVQMMFPDDPQAVQKIQTNRTEIPALDEEKSTSVTEDSTSGKSFDDLYGWGRLVFEGTFTVTHEVRHKQSKEIFFGKKGVRNDLDEDEAVALQSEIACLRIVSDSPFVLRLVDVFEDPDATFLIQERANGGNLMDRIAQRECYPEEDAKIVARKVLLGLEHCHNKRIANRNIKAENLILSSPDSFLDVKIGDFSFAKKVPYPNALRTLCGTEGYTAPELMDFNPGYDVQCDMFSLGVTLYILLGGYRPFRGETEDIERAIRYGEFAFRPKKYWRHISDEAKLVISRMLTVSPLTRITATAALQSAWFISDSSTEYDSEEGEVMERPTGKIDSFFQTKIKFKDMSVDD